MGTNTKATENKNNSANAIKTLSLFEVEYFRQLQEELRIFLKGTQFSTVNEIVLGIKGSNYQSIIDIR